MKIGATYNVFDDSIEHLFDSILSIKNNVNYISIVYQSISNMGEQGDQDTLLLLKEIKQNNLVDEIFLYTPDMSLSPTNNELNKRNIGLNACRNNCCDYVILMDSDELYMDKELSDVIKKYCINESFDAIFCKMYTYYKYKNIILDPLEDYFVPVLYKIDEHSMLHYKYISPVTVDPTRILNNINKYIVCEQHEIMMHHLSYVRKNIRRKLENSSARINYNKYINELVDYYNNWEIGMPAKVAGIIIKQYNTKEINILQ